jgi:hypothetical protein
MSVYFTYGHFEYSTDIWYGQLAFVKSCDVIWYIFIFWNVVHIESKAENGETNVTRSMYVEKSCFSSKLKRRPIVEFCQKYFDIWSMKRRGAVA